MHLALLSWLFITVSGLVFELEATPQGNTRCIRDFVGSETFVVIKIKTDGRSSDGQRISMRVKDSQENTLAFRDNLKEKVYQTFSPSRDTSFDVCFTNTLEQGTGSSRRVREIELETQIGAAARDWAALQASEKLKPTELKLKQIAEKTQELYQDLEHMKLREEKLRDTNESTNRRVKNFFVLVFITFLGLGAWQIIYLRAYFRSKHIL